VTNIFMESGSHALPVVDPGAADGVFSLLWLVIALPLFGALVLLVGGPLT
jgi:NADH-quinone oxidoreductase subunit L